MGGPLFLTRLVLGSLTSWEVFITMICTQHMTSLRLEQVKATLLPCEETGVSSTCPAGPKVILIKTIISLMKSEPFKEEIEEIEVFLLFIWASQVALVVKISPANAGNVRDTGSTPGSGRSPGEGNGNPLQYSCLKNSTDSAAMNQFQSTWRPFE